MRMLSDGIRKLVLVTGLTLCSLAGLGQEQLLDKVIAQLGDHIVLSSDLAARMEELKQQQMQDPNSPPINMNACQILEQMLFEHLLLNQAELDSVIIDEERVSQEMDRRLRYFESMMGGREKLEEFYGKTIAQIKDEFFIKIEEQMKVDEMRGKITGDVSASPKQIRDFFSEIPKDSLPYVNSKVILAHLVIFPKISEQDEENVRQKMMELREEITSGQITFEQAASTFSRDPGSAAEGGDLGWQERGSMVKEFESTVFSLKEGEISVPVKTEFGFHIIKLIERRGNLFRAKHILMDVRPTDEALERAAETIDSVHAEIKAGNLDFEKAVLLYSNDKSSNKNKGFMANPYTGEIEWDMKDLSDLDATLVGTVNSLQPGDITTPALYNDMQNRRQGVRIVKLVKRTPPHIANLEDDWSLIKMAADNNLKQQAMNDWVGKKIQFAFVRIEPEYNCESDFQFDWFPEQ